MAGKIRGCAWRLDRLETVIEVLEPFRQINRRDERFARRICVETTVLRAFAG